MSVREFARLFVDELAAAHADCDVLEHVIDTEGYGAGQHADVAGIAARIPVEPEVTVKAVRFTRAEREYLVALLPEDNATARKVAAKLATADAVTPKGLPVAVAIDAFRRALRDRLIVPLSKSRGVYAAMQKRLTALGLSEADCYEVARVAGEVWEGAIRAESLVRQADKLLGGPGVAAPTIPGRGHVAPVTLGDDDL